MPNFIQLKTLGQYQVPYREHHDGVEENQEADNVTMTRICSVAWKDRLKFCWDATGYTETAPTPEGFLKRHLPEPHPWDSRMRVRNCRLRELKGVPNQDAEGRMTIDLRSEQGEIPANGAGSGDGWAVYAVQYNKPNYFFKEDSEITSELDRYVVRRPRIATDSLTLRGQSLKFGAEGDVGWPDTGPAIPASIANKLIPGDTTREFPIKTLTYIWLQVPAIPYAGISDCHGRVNSDYFDPDFGNYPPETVLCYAVEPKPTQYPGPVDFMWDIHYTFLIRDDPFDGGWNKVFSPVAGAMHKAVRAGDTSRGLRLTANFAALFKLS